MKSTNLLVALAASILLHAFLGLVMSRFESDKDEKRENLKMRVVDKEKKKAPEKVKTARELELEKQKAEENKRKAEEALKRLELLRKKQEEKRKKAEEEKKKEEKKPEPPKPEPPKPEPPKPEPAKVAKPEESKPPPVKKKKKVHKKRRTEKKTEKKVEQPVEVQPPDPNELKAAPTKGAPIDLDYAMSGGTGDGGIPVLPGDGTQYDETAEEQKERIEKAREQQEAWEEQQAKKKAEEIKLAEADESDDGWVDADDQAEEARDAAAAEAGGKGGDGEPAPQADPRRRKVKTTASYKVTRDAKVKKNIKIEYPDEVRALEVQGRVYLLLTIDKEGKVANVEMKKRLHPVLDEAAMEAAWKLEFEPAMKKGKVVGVKIPYVFTFVLE